MTAISVKNILRELRHHAPFTMLGALLGIVFMVLFREISHAASHTLFAVFHPAHVILSAMVTASLFRLRSKRTSFAAVLIIGYLGSVGIATVSDCIIPYAGEQLLGLHVPRHQEIHAGDHTSRAQRASSDPGQSQGVSQAGGGGHSHGEGPAVHLGFIEEWYLVNPAALLGIVFAFVLPRTRLPHAGHVLISTWASLAHILMNMAGSLTAVTAAGVFAVLFLAVWLPCCVSDIVFPMLFAGADEHACAHH